ncbi:MAG TPA: hypothetical protein VH143_08240 [Kofleriaceae bacterium]|jgi:hypothetical protein|nr:hypothetical protein [Kofleriaceae bacterium]
MRPVYVVLLSVTLLVELSGTDTGAAVTWDSAVAVPPEQMVGPCTYGG